MSKLDTEIAEKVRNLASLGMEMDMENMEPFQDEEEKADFLDQLTLLEELAGQDMLVATQPATVTALTPLITAVFPESMAAERDAALAQLLAEEAKGADAFAGQGLYLAYEKAFAPNNLSMSIPLNAEVEEIVRLANAALTAHGFDLVSEEELGTLKTLTNEAQSPEDYIDQLWTALSDLLPAKGLTLLDMRPSDGAWSVCAMIFIPSNLAEEFDMTGYGDFMLEMLLGEEIEEAE